jgi:hypothetical protein
MKVNGNQEVVRPTAGINWLSRQLKPLQESDLIVKAVWPGRTENTHAPLAKVLENAELLVPDGQKDVPKEFEIIRVLDLGGKFKGQKVFVEQVVAALPLFYSDVGERLSNWIAPPPKTKKKSEEQEDAGEFPEEIDRLNDADEANDVEQSTKFPTLLTGGIEGAE